MYCTFSGNCILGEKIKAGVEPFFIYINNIGPFIKEVRQMRLVKCSISWRQALGSFFYNSTITANIIRPASDLRVFDLIYNFLT